MAPPSIHDYCKKGDTAGVRRCLDESADAAMLLDKERASGFTPLMVAVWYGHDDIVSALLQHGADANRRLNTASYANGVTPLFMAARNGWPKVAMLLLGGRADPELRRASDGSTPLATAAKHGRTEVIQVLVRAGVAIDSPDSDDSTPLLLAAKHGHPSVVELLLKSGAEPNGSTAWRPNALVVAAHQDDVAVIDAILRAKPSCVNMKLPNGATALHMAAACGNVAATTRLLDAGANPERCRRDGQTAASLASANGHMEVRQIISDNLAVVEGRRPAVSKLQRLKRLQQSAKVMQGLGARSDATPSESRGPGVNIEQQLGRGARAFASLGLGQASDNHEPVDQRPSSSASVQSRATSSGSHSAQSGSDDEGVSAGSASAWKKVRLVSKLSSIGRDAVGDRDAARLIAMKKEIVNSVGLLSKKGYQLAMDMLAVDGNTDGLTLELDDLSPELVSGLHALVTDSAHHSKRHRHHRSRRHSGSSKADSAEQQSESTSSPDANPAAVDSTTDPAQDAAISTESQEPSEKDPTAATEADNVMSESGLDHRHHRHHRHHHDAHHHHHHHHYHQHVGSPSNDDMELDPLVEQPTQPEPEAETDVGNDGPVRLPLIAVSTDAAGGDSVADVETSADPINLPEIEVGASSRTATDTPPAGHSSRSRSSHSRGSSRSSRSKATPGPAGRKVDSSKQESRHPAQGFNSKERRGSAASEASVASGSTVVSAQTDSEDERIVAALRR